MNHLIREKSLNKFFIYVNVSPSFLKTRPVHPGVQHSPDHPRDSLPVLLLRNLSPGGLVGGSLEPVGSEVYALVVASEGTICPWSPGPVFFAVSIVACGPLGGCWDLVTKVPSSVVAERGWGFRGLKGAAGGQTVSFPGGLDATTSGLSWPFLWVEAAVR